MHPSADPVVVSLLYSVNGADKHSDGAKNPISCAHWPALRYAKGQRIAASCRSAGRISRWRSKHIPGLCTGAAYREGCPSPSWLLQQCRPCLFVRHGSGTIFMYVRIMGSLGHPHSVCSSHSNTVAGQKRRMRHNAPSKTYEGITGSRKIGTGYGHRLRMGYFVSHRCGLFCPLVSVVASFMGANNLDRCNGACQRLLQPGSDRAGRAAICDHGGATEYGRAVCRHADRYRDRGPWNGAIFPGKVGSNTHQPGYCGIAAVWPFPGTARQCASLEHIFRCFGGNSCRSHEFSEKSSSISGKSGV